jgi:hypothetical protein
MKFSDINRKIHLNIGGIYLLKSTIDSRIYVGSTKSFYNRLMSHKNALLHNYHKGNKLLNFINKYGIDFINIDLIPLNCLENELRIIEKNYIIKYNSVNEGFNCSEETTNAVVPYTEERRRKISETSKGRIKSKETCKKLSDNSYWKNCLDQHPNAKLNLKNVILIKKLLLCGYKSVDISKLFPFVKSKTIYNVATNNKWGSVIINENDITNEEKKYFQTLFDLDNKIIKKNLTYNNVKFIKFLLINNSTLDQKKTIQSIYNISRQVLNSILNGRNYINVQPERIKEEEIKYYNSLNKINSLSQAPNI